MERFVSVFGILLVLAICYALSTNRKAIQGRTILWGLGMQFVLALFVLKTPFGQAAFAWVGHKIQALLELSYVGSAFVFGKIGMKGGGDTNVGFIFATQILPAILFVAALFAVLYHLGVMQLVVRAVAKVMTRLMGASGAESLNVAASIFMGQTEAPLTIRPFLNKMTQSELMCVMTSGMAHVSGGIMAAYIGFGIEAKHLLAAVIMTAPGTILLAKMLVPETGKPETAGDVNFSSPQDRHQHHRRGGARHRRGPAPGAERRRHAHHVPGAGGARERVAGRARRRRRHAVAQPGAHPRLGVRAAGARHGRSLGRGARGGQPAWAPAWC